MTVTVLQNLPEVVVVPADETLAVRDLDGWYGSKLALENVNLAAVRGSVTAIIGPSGCGKSTLLRCFNRLNDDVPGFEWSGRLLLDGNEVGSDPGSILTLRRRVGMVFQRPTPFPQSIFDNVAYGKRLDGRIAKRELAEDIEKALVAVGLWDEVKDRLDRSALTLSGGQQQRLCMARALAVEPDALLMDEPTSALDPAATLRIEELIRELSSTVTIVIVTHNMQQAARVSDTCAFILTTASGAGTIIESGATEQMFGTPRDQRTADYIAGRFG